MSKTKTFVAGQDAKGYYRILRVTPQASLSEIKQTYRTLAKEWHPDHCRAPNALEMFQQLSTAYETLQEEESRLIYDLLSLVYSQADYPELENIEPLGAAVAAEKTPTSRRSFSFRTVRGLLWKYKLSDEKRICNYKEALGFAGRTALLNWLLGWWNPRAFFKNIQALLLNFQNVDLGAENLRLLVHNAIAYYRKNNFEAAVSSAVEALNYAPPPAKIYLQTFIARLNIRISRPHSWRFGGVRLVQLLFPALLFLVAVIPFSVQYVTEIDLMRWFKERNEITYYQEVNFGSRGRSVDDVVVGKILNFPVDRSDVRHLYHLKSATALMHGPSEDFDVLKTVKNGQTVRLTGMSPDNIWARVMIDNGEMGFVRVETLAPGIGKPIPEFSKIYSPL